MGRDGVINENKDNGVTTQELFVFIKGAKKALARLSNKGFHLVVVTNQSYVGNGQMTEYMLKAIHNNMTHEIAKAGGYVRGIYSCTHSESEQCECRKPNIGLFKQASSQLGINLEHSWVIGDQYSDIEAGERIGARIILVLTGEGKRTSEDIAEHPEKIKPDKTVADMIGQ